MPFQVSVRRRDDTPNAVWSLENTLYRTVLKGLLSESLFYYLVMPGQGIIGTFGTLPHALTWDGTLAHMAINIRHRVSEEL